ncbi:MAG: tRNA-(ms[2]io[6]A)-hydroxylase [Planctomycetes bacterium]|nr:tRNA-(ms[2]io[6]A)-hydroxylase [Planctomycetota bacterium]
MSSSTTTNQGTRSARFVTPRTWARSQRAHVDALLLEQAHLEKKAAAGAVAFLFRLPTDPDRHRQLSALAREELLHFERALKLLRARGAAFAPQESSGYAERLKKAVRGDRRERLADELLIAAVIEMRSHERMQLLAEELVQVAPDAARFYAELCPQEERHEQLYLELAGEQLGGEGAARRHAELLRHEAEVLATLPWQPRLHGGLPDAVDVADARGGEG